MSKIEYAAKTMFTEDRNANAANLIPVHIRAEVDRINNEIRVADDEQYQRAVEVSQRAGLPIPERRG